eukprot:Skav219245  [mRNA]  locus=scaffold1242:273340:274864:+ [translate_table: standard]
MAYLNAQSETNLELGALPATILVTSNSHNVWTKQEVSPESQSEVPNQEKSSGAALEWGEKSPHTHRIA